jgi:hypothetical protein
MWEIFWFFMFPIKIMIAGWLAYLATMLILGVL